MNNKYQEALIKLVVHNYSTRSEKNEYINTLQKLVDKETPMKPIVSITTFETRRGKGYQTHYVKRTTCPKCAYDVKESYLGRMMSGNNYCYKCSQKLEWGDDND